MLDVVTFEENKKNSNNNNSSSDTCVTATVIGDNKAHGENTTTITNFRLVNNPKIKESSFTLIYI